MSPKSFDFSIACGIIPGVDVDIKSFLRSPPGIALAAIALLLLFFRLGAGSLVNSDDAIFAWAVRAAHREGAWLDYDWNGARLGFLYPPLHFILLRATTTLFGDNEFALRLPAAMAGLVAVLGAGAIAHRLTGSVRAGLVAGLLLCTSAHFYDSARSVRLDATLLALSTLCVYAYLRSWTAPRWLWVAGAFAGLAVLTKGVLGLIPLFPIALDICLAERDRRRIRPLVAASLLFLLIAASWHCRQLALYGWSFVDNYFLYSVFQRLHGIAGIGASSHFWLDTCRMESFHLVAWGAGAIWLVARARVDRAARMLLSWALVPLLIVSISGTRLPQYLVPALAPLAVACGCALSRFFDRKLAVFASAAAAVGVFLATSLAAWLHPDFSPGLRTLTALTRQEGDRCRLVAFNEYPPAVGYYADSPTLMITDDARAYRLLKSPRAMQDGAAIELIDPVDIPRRIAGRRPVCWLTSLFFERRLRGYLDQVPAELRARLEYHRDGLYILVTERQPQPKMRATKQTKM